MKFSKIIKDFEIEDSSAVRRIIVREDCVEIQFKTSNIVYKYALKDENFADSLQKCIDNKESVGKLVSNSIKEGKFELISKILP